MRRTVLLTLALTLLAGCIVVRPEPPPPEPPPFQLSVPGVFLKQGGRTWVRCESRVSVNDHCEFGL